MKKSVLTSLCLALTTGFAGAMFLQSCSPVQTSQASGPAASEQYMAVQISGPGINMQAAIKQALDQNAPQGWKVRTMNQSFIIFYK